LTPRLFKASGRGGVRDDVTDFTLEGARAMAKKIIELVREKMASMNQNPDEREPNAALAAEALMRGRLSLKWREYMMQFVEKDPNNPNEPLNPDQLARLLAADNTLGDPLMDRRRAYILSNGICGGGSTGAPTGGLPFDFTVESIDNGIGGVVCP
jgi:hypothetical protein